MGSSESYPQKKKDDNNIYAPNLLVKEMIEEDEPKNEINNKNKNYINRYNDFAELNNENRYDDNEIITNIKKNPKYNKNLFVAQTAEVIKMEITNQKTGLDYRKFKFNGITVVQNLKDYIPKDITREEIKDMIYTAFGEGLVDDLRYFIPGKTVTRKQANAIIDLIEQYIKEDNNIENLEDKSILDGINIVIDLVDLNKDIIKEKMFKGKNPSDLQLENILKNLGQGLNNVKILSIEFI